MLIDADGCVESGASEGTAPLGVTKVATRAGIDDEFFASIYHRYVQGVGMAMGSNAQVAESPHIYGRARPAVTQHGKTAVREQHVSRGWRIICGREAFCAFGTDEPPRR
jgi:hypothetical protein